MTRATIWQRTTNSLFLVLLGGGIALGGNYLINNDLSIAQNNT